MAVARRTSHVAALSCLVLVLSLHFHPSDSSVLDSLKNKVESSISTAFTRARTAVKRTVAKSAGKVADTVAKLRATSFKKDARALLKKVRATPGMAGIAPFVKRQLKIALSIPEQSTILIPLSVAQAAFILRAFSVDIQQQFINYHILTTYNKYSDLRAIATNTDLTTVEGSALTKVGRDNGTVVFFKDKGIIPKPIVIPNFLPLTNFVAHVISTVLVPPDFGGSSGGGNSSEPIF